MMYSGERYILKAKDQTLERLTHLYMTLDNTANSLIHEHKWKAEEEEEISSYYKYSSRFSGIVVTSLNAE